MCRLLETKASSDEVDAAVRRLSCEVHERAHAGDLQKALSRQELVNKGFSSNMSVGRWMWNSGKSRTRKGIPWNVQTMNRYAAGCTILHASSSICMAVRLDMGAWCGLAAEAHQQSA